MTAKDIEALCKPLLAYPVQFQVTVSGGAYCYWANGADTGKTLARKYKLVSVPNVPSRDDSTTLLTALHEVGHTHVEHMDDIPLRRAMNTKGLPTPPAILENEAAAWLWALDAAAERGIEVSAACVDHISSAQFGSYLSDSKYPFVEPTPHTDELLRRLDEEGA